MSGLRARRWVVTVSLVPAMAAALFAACAGDDGPSFVESDLPSVGATFAERSGRIEGTLTIDGRSADIEGEFAGSKFGEDGRGRVSGAVPFEPEVPFSLTWSGQNAVSLRSESAPDSGPWPLLLVAPGALGSGDVVTPIAFLRDAIEPLFPPAFLERLAVNNPTAVESDGDVSLLTFDFAPNQFGDADSTMTLRIDPDAKLERVTMRTIVSGSTAELDYAVTYTDDEVQVTTPETTRPVTPPLEPSGEYEEVLAGSSPEGSWQLFRAPIRGSSSCWKVTSTPPLVVDDPNAPDDTRCIAAPDPSDDIADQVVVVLTSNDSPGLGILVAQLPASAESVSFGFFGGRLVPAEIDDGLVVWSGDGAANPVYLEVGLDDGRALACGMGALSSSGELRDAQLADVRLGQPWTCSLA